MFVIYIKGKKKAPAKSPILGAKLKSGFFKKSLNPLKMEINDQIKTLKRLQEQLPDERIIQKSQFNGLVLGVRFRFCDISKLFKDANQDVKPFAKLIKFCRWIENETEFEVGFSEPGDEPNVCLPKYNVVATKTTMAAGKLRPELLEKMPEIHIFPHSHGKYLATAYDLIIKPKPEINAENAYKTAFITAFFDFRNQFKKMYHSGTK